MPVPEIETNEIAESLRKFYRHTDISLEETDRGILFVISNYRVRDAESDCRAALLVEGREAYILVDRHYADVGQFLTGNEGRKEISGASWIVVPESYFWDLRRPPYWFVERNLTAFFRKKSS